MSVLAGVKSQGAINDALLAIARPLFEQAIWAWFHENQDRVVFSKWGIIRVTVGALRPLIEILAGPEPKE